MTCVTEEEEQDRDRAGYSRSKDALTIDWISCIEAGEHLVIPAMNNHFLQAVFSKTYSRCKKAKFALADDIV